MNFKYIFLGGFILGTGIGVMLDDDNIKNNKRRILNIFQVGVGCSLAVGGSSLSILGLTNLNS